jgi:stage II sporulation protein P
MNKRVKIKRVRKFKSFIYKIIYYLIMICAAIAIGVFSGNFLSNVELGKLLQSVNVTAYKSIIDDSLPIVSTVYNNGSLSTTLSDEIKNFVSYIIGFDIDEPISILNAQSSILNSYYTTTYIASKENNGKENAVVNEPDNKIAENPEEADKGSGGLEERASSISTDNAENPEKEEPSKNEIVSDGKIIVQNETKNKVNIEELLKAPLKFSFNKKTDRILIYHTHTTESYIKDISQLNSNILTRSLDPKLGVVRVGEELAQNFRKKYGIQVIHNATINDYPDYNKSYNNSLKTVSTILKSYPSIKITIDLHRDAIGDSRKLREIADVKGKKAAKVMLVMTTGDINHNHPNWKENLKLALKIQEKLLEQCPEITQPIQLSKYTYNEHLSEGGLLIEVGGDGNLMSECLESTKYLAKAINDAISKN